MLSVIIFNVIFGGEMLQAESQQEDEERYLFGKFPAHFSEGMGRRLLTPYTNSGQKYAIVNASK